MHSRSFVLAVLVAVVTLVLAGCTTTSSDDEVVEAADDAVAEVTDDATDDEVVEATDDAAEEATDDATVEETGDEAVEAADDAETEATDDVSDDAVLDDDELDAVLTAFGFESEEEVEAPVLDIETMTAETPGMTMQAEEYDHTYVGAVTDELYVAISLDSMYSDQAEGISIYVCDGDEIGFYLTGELEDGQATLALSEDAHIELLVNGESISGSVTFNGEELSSFDAVEAAGDAGLYVARDTIDDVEVVSRWVVLEDGSQRGQLCIGIRVGRVCVGISHN